MKPIGGAVVRTIHIDTVIETVRQLCLDANYQLKADTLQAYHKALKQEESELGQEVLRRLIKNAEVAKQESLPFCQDTGYAVCFVNLGQEVQIIGGLLTDAINEGVRQGYTQGRLRKSLVINPIFRKNTQDNTPAMINYDIVLGDKIKIFLLVKGGGCDNRSAIRMFTPAEGLPAAKKFIVDTIEQAGPNASPPVVIGVGLGGPFPKAALLAQQALLWPIGKENPDPTLAELEKELITKINDLGIGPAGFGGTVTTLGLHIEAGATHITSFPVAINIDCHSHRGKEIII